MTVRCALLVVVVPSVLDPLRPVTRCCVPRAVGQHPVIYALIITVQAAISLAVALSTHVSADARANDVKLPPATDGNPSGLRA